MSARLWARWVKAVAALTVTCVLWGCNDDLTGYTSHYAGTSAPGDTWTVEYTSAFTFQVKNTTPGKTSVIYSGTYEQVSSGFEQLNVTSTTDPAFSTPTKGYVKTIADVGTLVWLGGATSPPIMGLTSRSCPGSQPLTTYNVIRVPASGENWAPPNNYFFGIMQGQGQSRLFDFPQTLLNSVSPSTATVTPPDDQSPAVQWGCGQHDLARQVNLIEQTIIMGPSDIALRDDGIGMGGAIGVPQVNTVASDKTSGLNGTRLLGFQFNPTPSIANVTEAIEGTYVRTGSFSISVPGYGQYASTCTGTAGCIVMYSVNPVTGSCIDTSQSPPPACSVTNAGVRLISVGENISSPSGIQSGLLAATFDTSNTGAIVITILGGRRFVFGATYTGSGIPYNFFALQK